MPIITISRGSLSGGEMLAEALGTRLGYRVISREVIFEAAHRYDVTEAKLQHEMHDPAGIWGRLTHQKKRYLTAVQAALAEMVKQGKVVYHGLAGHFLLKDLPHVLDVRLVVPFETRVRAGMISQGLTRQESEAHIHLEDEQRARWVRQLYGEEWDDPTLYDLVINLDQLSVESAVDMVAALAERKEYQRTPKIDAQVKDFVLTARIRAELTFHADYDEEDGDFAVHSGVVHLRESGTAAKHKEELIRFLRNIDGVRGVVTDATVDLGCAAEETSHTAAEIMLPLSDYPQIHEWNTVAEAMLALSGSSIQLKDGHLLIPRYLLVFDEQGALVGVINRRNLLKGLSPQLKGFQDTLERYGASALCAGLPGTVTLNWFSFFSDAALAHAQDPVKPLTAPIRGWVEVDQDLSVVVTTMLDKGIDLVPVMDQGQAVGVIIMTDLFDSVAEFVLENKGK